LPMLPASVFPFFPSWSSRTIKTGGLTCSCEHEPDPIGTVGDWMRTLSAGYEVGVVDGGERSVMASPPVIRM
jgi:hypothetical protein